MEVITLTISILGALAWLPFLIEISKRSKILGKVINYFDGTDSTTEYTEFGQTKTAKGIQYIIKISAAVLSKSFYLKDTEVYVKYKNDGTLRKGIIFWPDNFVITDSKTKTQKHLKIKENESIKFLHVLQKDETTNFYVIFIVENIDKINITNYEYFEFHFINYKGKKLKLKIRREDIDFKNILREKDMF